MRAAEFSLIRATTAMRPPTQESAHHRPTSQPADTSMENRTSAIAWAARTATAPVTAAYSAREIATQASAPVRASRRTSASPGRSSRAATTDTCISARACPERRTWRPRSMPSRWKPRLRADAPSLHPTLNACVGRLASHRRTANARILVVVGSVARALPLGMLLGGLPHGVALIPQIAARLGFSCACGERGAQHPSQRERNGCARSYVSFDHE